MKKCMLALTTAVVMFLGTVSAGAAEFVLDGDTVAVSGAPDNSTLIVALYKDGALSGTKISAGSGDITAELPEEAAEADVIKAFLWDMQTITPLEKAEEISDMTDETYDTVYITANGVTFAATLMENSSAEAFVELLKAGDVTIEMSDYGNFEKVGPLGTTIVRNDEQITTEPGDVILYQGNSITIYYDTNTWSFTRLAKIEGVTGEELKAVLGDGDVTVVFSLEA